MQQLTDLISTARCTDLTNEQRHAAFGQLIDRFQGALYARAVRIVRDPQLAQDITQETLLTAYQQLPNLREPAAFPIWLNQILRTHCNRLRRRPKVATVALVALEEYEAIDIDKHDPAAALAATDIRDHVLAAIATLPEHERIVVHLFYLQEFSLKEIAERLKLPLTTIKKRLQYARGRLRVEMSETVEMGVSRRQPLVVQLQMCLLALCTVFLPSAAVYCPVLAPTRPARVMPALSYSERY
jgi:RNA polymerase sigma-70 factor (ECF subfamily)